MKSIRLFILSATLTLLLTACGTVMTPSLTEGPPTPAFAPSMTPPPTNSGSAPSLDEQMSQIDAIMKRTLEASIAYNTPGSMILDQTATIELLLNPALSPEALSTQVTEAGQVTSTSVQTTPRMKAMLFAENETAFDIKPIHDNPEQLISATDTTRWAWLVTARKSGPQRLTLIIYRLIEYNGQDYWREIKTYKADIEIKVTMLQHVEALDWGWIIGILVSAIAIPAFWRWYDNRRKQNSPKRKGSPKE